MANNQECVVELTDVFSVYGHASFYATLFEMELVALIQTVMPTASVRRSEWEQIDAKLRKFTLGPLKRELQKHVALDDDFENYLEQMIELRNFLTHHFYEDHLLDLQTDTGRKRVLDELKIICVRLKNVCDNVRAIYRKIAKDDFGFDTDFLKQT